MFAKRFSSPGVMIVLRAMSLVGGGCATTSSEASKPHKPQMITSDTEKEGLYTMSDGWANLLTYLGTWFGLPR
jgi:hypothetical protein